MGHPTIYPTGVTVYNPEKCWNGFTIFQALEVGAVLMNMNGRENKVWKGVHGFPNKIFPGGYLMTSRGSRDGRYGVQDGLDLVQIDWDGNVVWKFDRNEYIEDPGIPGRWMARSHHDYQREGSTTGYYAPGMEPKTDSGNTLVLAHRNARNPKISDKQLLDDVILEVDWDGDIVWEWHCNEHFDEMGFREGPKNTLARDPNYRQTQPEGMGDWMHINSMSVLGPTKWHDAGDERFHLQAFFRRARAKGGGFQREARLGCPFHIRFACQKEIEHAHQPRVRRAPGLRNVLRRVLVRDL